MPQTHLSMQYIYYGHIFKQKKLGYLLSHYFYPVPLNLAFIGSLPSARHVLSIISLLGISH